MSWSKQRIRQEAQQLLQSGRIDKPPVPIERLARQLGARIRYEPFRGELSGMLFRENGHAIIGVNSLHAPTRQRFTVAHELAHLVLHTDRLYVDQHFRVRLRDERSSQATDPDEIAANTLAAEILMPANMLIRDVSGKALDPESDEAIRRLADKYEVSVQAMTVRLTSLGLLAQAMDLSF